MSLFASWGPYWVKRSSPPSPVVDGPIFQSGWINNPGIINTLVNLDPNQYNRPSKIVVHPIANTSGIGVASEASEGSNAATLYDPLTDMVYAINSAAGWSSGFSGFGSAYAAVCIDPREMKMKWRTDLSGMGYNNADIIGVTYSSSLSHHLVWYRCWDAATGSIPYIISLSAVDGVHVHTLELSNPITAGGNEIYPNSNYNTALVLNDDTITFGIFSSNTGTYFMPYLKVTGLTTFTLGSVDLPGDTLNYTFYPDSIWTDNASKAYVLYYSQIVETPAPLVTIVNLTTMTITETIDAPDTSGYSPARFQLNEDKTRVYISNQGQNDSSMLEWDVTVPGWSYLGKYGSNLNISVHGYQADEYVYDNGIIYSFSNSNGAMMKWKVGEYTADGTFYGDLWSAYRNYYLNYGFHEYQPFSSRNSTYNSGHCSDFWFLPKSKRPYTPPTYTTTPPVTAATLNLGLTDVPVTEKVTWAEYDFTGIDSVEFNVNGSSQQFTIFIFDSDGCLLTYSSNNLRITRNLALRGKYYIAFVQTSWSEKLSVGTKGWSINIDGLAPLQFTETISVQTRLSATESQ